MILEPIVEILLGSELHHGERGKDLDPFHPQACLCGESFYLSCPAYLDGDHLGGWTIGLDNEGIKRL